MPEALDWNNLGRASLLLLTVPEPTGRAARVIELEKAAHLFSRDDRPKAMYVIISGEVHLVRRSHDESEIVLQSCSGGFLAEASLDQPAYHCDAIAVASSRVLALPREAFLAALDDEIFRHGWLTHLARELWRARAQAERLRLRIAGDRIVHYIETEGENGSIVLSQSKKDWASELGLTHEALYRTLAQLKRAGRISVDGSAVSIRR